MNTFLHLARRVGLLSILACLSLPLLAAQYVLEWDRVDPRAVNYRIYYGQAHRSYDQWIDVGDVDTYTVTGLEPDAVYYFAVKADDGTGESSDFSNEVTSGRFRYVFGLGADRNNDGRLELANMNRLFEQTVAAGWAEYNALSGAMRIATGDIDGDGKHEIVIGFAKAGSGLPGGRFQILDDDFSHLAWGQVDWPDYNAVNGETRPAVGDVTGDGKAEIFIGLGREGGGSLQIFSYADGSLQSLGWTDVNWPGHTWPALGDIDGDGRAELVVGLDSTGTFLIKKGFDENLLAAGQDPWRMELQGDLSWREYATQVGETRPALGDLNGDGTHEIAIGLAPYGGGYIEVFDYRLSSIVSMEQLRVGWSQYNDYNGETRLAIGDIDGDRRGEIIAGLGEGGGGYVELFEDAGSRFVNAANLMGPFGSAAYRTSNGSLWPAFKLERVSSSDGTPITTTGYWLEVLKTGAGSGTVGGGGYYAAGTTVTPTATAASGSTFAGWSPSSCGSSFSLSADTTCTATFTAAVATVQYALTVKTTGNGTLQSSPAGIDCSGCSANYASGTKVTLTPVPGSGFTFRGWSGACSGTGTCTVTMDGAKTVTANFRR